MNDTAAWKCPWCGWQNNRDHEGLDECENCHSEAATHYSRYEPDVLVVKIAHEPPAPRPPREK